jgi:hypothetical protein
LKLFLLACTSVFLLGVVPGSAAVLYDNGAINGTQGTGAPPIHGVNAVSDSFVLLAGSTITGTANLGLWETHGDTPSTVDWSIGTGPFGGTVASGTATWGLTFLFTNAFNFDIYSGTFAIPNVSLAAGTYWLELTNAVATSAGSTFWDVSKGPSSAFIDPANPQTVVSESFQIVGNVNNSAVPEPGGIALPGAALALLYSVLRNRRSALRLRR